jgi:phage/plasmid-like protein (TIGR03299 family)
MVESKIGGIEKRFKDQQDRLGGGGATAYDIKESKRPEDSQVESMMYVGDKPWWAVLDTPFAKRGVELPALATAKEAITAAKLDYEIKLVPVYTHNPQGKIQKVEGKVAIQRATDGKVYNILGRYYTPVQNRDAFSFFDAVCGTGKAKYETAGSLRDGSRIWIMARLDREIHVLNNEEERVDCYVTLMNCHDGSSALLMFHHPFRIVCWNTLRAATGLGADKFYARHTSGALSKIEAARAILGITDKFFNEFEDQANYLAMKQLPAAEMPKLLMAAFGTTGAEKLEDVYAPVFREMKKVEEMMEVVPNLQNPKIKGTAWAAYNAISQYTDHVREYRGKDQADARLNGVWLGGGAAIKDRAWDYLIKSVK